MAASEARRRSRFGQYKLTYTVYGCDLDVDGLLLEARPQCEFRVWRKGDEFKPGRPMETSGIGIEILETNDTREMGAAIEAFLEKEESFVGACGKRTGENLWSVLGCRAFIYSAMQGKLWLAPAVLARLGELDVELEINSYPCSEPEDN